MKKYIINPKASAMDVSKFQNNTIELDYNLSVWLVMLNSNALSDSSRLKALNSNVFIKEGKSNEKVR
jgi:hypothetical protein